MAGRKGQLDADPAERARRAAQECREATREAHEAIQALAEITAELRGLITEAQQFTLAHVAQAVPREVERQLDALLPVTQQAMNDAVAKVGKEFERIEAKPTPVEAAALAKNPEAKRAARIVKRQDAPE